MLTDSDIERIVKAVAAKQEHQTCPLGLTPDAVTMVNSFAEALRVGKKAAIKTAVGIVITAVLGMLALGFKEYLK